MTYAKIEAGALRVMGRVPNISNPTDEQAAAYAATHGFKELVETPQPGRYYRKGYAEGEDAITETWKPWELEEAKGNALETVQDRLDAVLDARQTIPCEGFPAGIVYDRNALINAGGLKAGMQFIDAADGVHTLTAEQVETIKGALTEKRQELYAATTQVRVRIANAQDVDEVEAALELAAQLAAN
ncbi:MAG: hypothetical protein Q4C88_06800 [Akkermansia sp.]|nr:hypothetical protein [Akkermansia sp.]